MYVASLPFVYHPIQVWSDAFSSCRNLYSESASNRGPFTPLCAHTDCTFHLYISTPLRRCIFINFHMVIYAPYTPAHSHLMPHPYTPYYPSCSAVVFTPPIRAARCPTRPSPERHRSGQAQRTTAQAPQYRTGSTRPLLALDNISMSNYSKSSSKNNNNSNKSWPTAPSTSPHHARSSTALALSQLRGHGGMLSTLSASPGNLQ